MLVIRAGSCPGSSGRIARFGGYRKCVFVLGLVGLSTSSLLALCGEASLEPGDPFKSMLPLLKETVQLEEKFLHDVFDDDNEDDNPSNTKQESKPVSPVHTDRLIGWTSASWPACKSEMYNENQLRDIAARLGEFEFQAAGYNAFLLDGCWALPERDSQGRLQPDPERFPSGMKALVDFVRRKGLRFGIGTYLDNSCSEMHTPGVGADPDHDVALFTEWGVDFIKVNACGAPARSIHAPAANWRSAINSKVLDRYPQLVCSWFSEIGSSLPEEKLYTSKIQTELSELGKFCDVVNIFETTPPTWDSMKKMAATWQARVTAVSSVRHKKFQMSWSPQFLSVNGLASRNLAELRTQFSLWALSGAPIMLAHDITKVPQDVVDILTERGATDVAANVDTMWGNRSLGDGSVQAWISSLFGPRFAIGVSNWGDTPVTHKIDWAEFRDWLGIVRGYPHEIEDIWRHENRGIMRPDGSPLVIELGPHETVLLKSTIQDREESAQEQLPVPQVAGRVPRSRGVGLDFSENPTDPFAPPVDGPVLFPTPAFSSRPILRGSGKVRIFRIGSIISRPPRPARESPFDHLVKTMDQLANQLVTKVIPDLMKDGPQVKQDGARDATKAPEVAQPVPQAKASPAESAEAAVKTSKTTFSSSVEKPDTEKIAKSQPDVRKGQATAASSKMKESGSESSEQPEATQKSSRTGSWSMFVAGLVAAGLLIAFVLVGRALFMAYTKSKVEGPARMQLMQCERPHAS
ncbi:Alpha-galactosidase [Toxoplasma gondii GT1]|uniref:Alpha-galactosidase n=3 Tax=Toxoplasma gondii TaxID=5811 RepID=S7UMA1_TOXGG|nr:Alpha-galactosidase [Toxoplasma gondii GT1]KAF4645237.1 Alpha-galactosidase [Toxoplasma gondii]KFG53096.1 Alpha-galactosidase [Toxoplasma gondii FOU]